MKKIVIISLASFAMLMFLTFYVDHLSGPVWTRSPQLAEIIPLRARPDPQSTEGSVRPDGHDRTKVCGASKAHRGWMTPERRDEVLLRYGLPPGRHPDYEIDHLIPVCLGGSDDFTNLWPQPRRSIELGWNAEAKDRLESRLCYQVCDGEIDLETAQEEIAKDWIAAYRKYFR